MSALLALISEVGIALVSAWAKAVRSGDVAAAERATRIIAETAAAKAAIRAARRK